MLWFRCKMRGVCVMKRLVIAGSRDFNDYELLNKVLSPFVNQIDVVVSGTARGADRLGERFAREHNIKLIRFKADWEFYGRSAGYVRNEKMAIYCTDVCVFWDGESRGTKHMMDLADKYGKPKMVIKYKEL